MLAAQPLKSTKEQNGTETFLMIDTCAGASVFPKNFDKRAIKDDTVPKTTLRTATNGEVTMSGGRRSTFTLRNGAKVAVRYNESNVSFPIVSVGEATMQGSWFVFGPGGQAMIGPDAGAVLEKLVTSKAAVQLQKSRGVYWLPCTTASEQGGAAVPLCAVRREAEAKEAPLAVEDGAVRGIAQGSAAPAAAQPSRPGSSDDHLKLDESEETRKPNVKRLPPQVAQEEVDRHNVTHLPFRSWCQHCVRGKATDDHHKRLAPTSVAGDAKWGMDYFFLTRAEEPNKMKAVLNCLDMQSGATFAAMVHKGADDYALAMIQESLKFTGRNRIIILSDQENSIKKVACMVRDSRPQETVLLNTPVGSSASAGGIERCNYEVEKQIRTLRSRFEEVYKQPLHLEHVALPWLVRHAAWQITHYQVKSDGRTPYERLRGGRPYNGQVAEFGEIVHYRDPTKASEQPKLDSRWTLGVWLGKSLASDEHFVGTDSGVHRCRSIWRQPEKQRWDVKVLERMVGEPWNPKPVVEARGPRGVYISLNRQIKHGGTPGCTACFGHAKQHTAECRKRFEELMAKEPETVQAEGDANLNGEGSAAPAAAQGSVAEAAAQTAQAPDVPMEGGKAAEPDVAMAVGADDEAPEAKRRRSPIGLMAMPTMHSINDMLGSMAAQACGEPPLQESAETEDLCGALPEDDFKQQLMDPFKEYYDTKSGKLLDRDKVHEGRKLEIENMQRLEVYETIDLAEAKRAGMDIVYTKWLDGEKPTAADPDAVRSRLVATQINTYAREDVTQATPPIKVARMVLSTAASAQDHRGQYKCLIGRHDIRVAFFHAKGSGNVVLVPVKGLAPPGTGWRALKAMYGTREASKCWGNTVTDFMLEVGCEAVVVVPMTFVNRRHGYIVECHGDDFLSAGSAEALDQLDKVLTERFDTKVLPRVGPPSFGGQVTEGPHLGRIIRWTTEAVSYTHMTLPTSYAV